MPPRRPLDTRNSRFQHGTTEPMEASVSSIALDDSRIADVQRLWREHSDTLGFFPQGAFHEYALKGFVLGAEVEGSLAGYLLYREARGWAVIVHLCVAPEWRRQGVPEKLLASLKQRTTTLYGIRLSCRSDFAASSLWPRLGFHQVSERDAKKEGKYLCRWALDYGTPDLFTHQSEDLATAVLDMNIILDLATEGREHRDEALPLLEPWVRESFHLAITPELLNEIANGKVAEERHRLRRWVQNLRLLRSAPTQVEAERARVHSLLGRGRTQQERADRRHLAYAAAARAEVFVTRDTGLLEHTEELHNLFGLRVERPGSLIADLDLTQRPDRYEPARLAGTGLSAHQIRSDEMQSIAETFASTTNGESPSRLTRIIAAAAARPESSACRVVHDQSNKMLSLEIRDRIGAELTLRAIRLRGGSMNSTLARHLLWNSVTEARRLGAEIVRVEEEFIPREIYESFTELGFHQTSRGWAKLIMRGVLTRAEARRTFGDAQRRYQLTGDAFGRLVDDLSESVVDPGRSLRIERELWPLKVRDFDVPCYIVPIQPAWATQLFDERMAAESLFGGPDELMLRTENAYYKSAAPAVIGEAGRVLWYISGKGRRGGYSHAGTIASAAQVTERRIGTAREVFRAYKRYGIFRWDDVLQVSGGSPENQVLAFQFARQEALSRPVRFEDAQKILHSTNGARNNFMSAVQITPATWCALYEGGGGHES